MENPDDPAFDRSCSTVADEESSFWVNLRFCKRSIYSKITFKNLTFEQYKILIYIYIFLNGVSFLIECLYLVQLCHDKRMSQWSESLVPLIVTVLSFLNIFIMAKLTRLPTTQLALGSLSVIICLEVAYITQTCLTYAGSSKSAEIAMTSLFIVLQFFSAVMMYRYWEMILYNYDGPSESSQSNRNTLTSLPPPGGSPGSNRISFSITGNTSFTQHSENSKSATEMRTALTEAVHMRDAMGGGVKGGNNNVV